MSQRSSLGRQVRDCGVVVGHRVARAGGCAMVFVALALLVPAEAQAQNDPPVRSGFWADVGIGYGSLGSPDFNEREDGFSGNLTLGGTISPRFLLGGGTTGWTKELDGIRITFSTLALMGRFYPNAEGSFFINGGLGAGQVSLSSGSTSISESGGGAIIGVGYDARVGSRWYLSPFANVIGYSIDGEDWNVFQFGVGLAYH